MNKTLDQIVKEGKQKDRKNRGDRNRRPPSNRSSGGPVRRNQRSERISRTPYSRPEEADQDKWGHDGFSQQNNSNNNGNGGRTVRTFSRPQGATHERAQYGTKITIENLKYDVLEPDLKELMEPCGTAEYIKVLYDEKTGRSEGKADIIFNSKTDAENAVQRYDGSSIDGQPMTVKLIGRVKIPGTGSPERNSGSFRSDRQGPPRSSRPRPARSNPSGKRVDRTEKTNNTNAMLIDEDIEKMKIEVSFN
uniref:RRM domain-containing protein n=1 Tax=Arcella intermedia TaxID=1963864 RepID=A0A6B2LF55_9EUKA